MLVALGIRRRAMRRPHPYCTVILVWKGAMFLFNEIKPHRFHTAVGTTKEQQSKQRKLYPDNRAPLVRFDGLQ